MKTLIKEYNQQKKNKLLCSKHNGIIICYCGQCKNYDHKLPEELLKLIVKYYGKSNR